MFVIFVILTQFIIEQINKKHFFHFNNTNYFLIDLSIYVVFLFLIDNAKWLLNVQWQMEGVDIHLDVNVGQQLSALGHTLTMLTGIEEDDVRVPTDYDSDDADQPEHNTSQVKLNNLNENSTSD